MKSLRFVCSFAIFMFAALTFAALTIMLAAAQSNPVVRANQLKALPEAQTLPAAVAAQFAPAGHEPLRQFGKTLRYDSGGVGAESVAIADLNGDGKLDLIVANFTQCWLCDNGGVSVLLGNGDGTFQPAVSYSSGGWGASSVAIADVNGDGKPDVVVTNWCLSTSTCAFGGGYSEGGVSVLLGNGDGTFQPAVSYDTGADSARSVAIGNLNGDGKLDLVVANLCQSVDQYDLCLPANTGGVSILLGNGDGTFQSPVIYSSGGYYADGVAMADLKGDGVPDLVVANVCMSVDQYGHCNGDGVLSVLLGNGDGTFQPATGYILGDADGIAIGDVNGDGIPDLVVAAVYVLLGNGDGTFQAPVYYNSGALFPASVAIADMNGDGIPDLVVGDSFPCYDRCDLGVYVLLGRGDGSFYLYSSYPAGGAGTESVAIADLNGDGKPDVVAANYYAKPQPSRPGDGEVGVLLNTFIAKTVTHLKSSLNPSHVNLAVTFAATITSGSAVPNGEVVTFYNGATEIGTGTTTSGVATLTTSFPTPGKYVIEASYPGDLYHITSSGTVKQRVKP